MLTNKNDAGAKRSKQTGFGLFSGAFLMVFLAVILIVLAPPYVENFSVRSCISSLAKDSAILAESADDIKTALLKKLSVSNVSHITEKDISIEKGNQIVKINVAYYVQTKFIKNVDFVVHFDEYKEASL